MFDKIILRNFRGIVEGELELSPLTILIGPNNSGKTTILEALLLAHGFRPIDGLNTYTLLSELHKTLESKGLDHLVYSYGARTRRAVVGYLVKGIWNYIIIDISMNAIDVYSLKDKDAQYTVEELLKLRIGELQANIVLRAERYSGRVFSFHSDTYLCNVFIIRGDLIKYYLDYIYKIWTDLSNIGITSRTAEWLSKALNTEYIDILAEPFGGLKSLSLYRSDKMRIRLGDLGDGVQVLTIAKLLIEYINPDVILWDDVEAHMNPRMLNLLAIWFSDLVRDKQIIVTTHSLEALEQIGRLVDKAKIVKLYINNKNQLEPEYYDISEIEKLRKLGIDVRS